MFAVLLAVPMFITAVAFSGAQTQELQHKPLSDTAKPEYVVKNIAHAKHAKKPVKLSSKAQAEKLLEKQVAMRLQQKRAMDKRQRVVQEYKQAMEVMHHKMHVTYTGDTDVDFVAGMIPHHQGAVDMAEVVLRHGRDPQLRELAKRIITAQKQEIGFMSSWLRGRKSNYRHPQADTLRSTVDFEQAMSTMHKDMDIRYTGDADLDFVRGMIPHHQGAVEMAYILQRDGKSLALRKLAGDIIRSQKQEIALMQEWLKKQPAGECHMSSNHSAAQKPRNPRNLKK
jgi:uncharacterized protein (DUF305 family)